MSNTLLKGDGAKSGSLARVSHVNYSPLILTSFGSPGHGVAPRCPRVLSIAEIKRLRKKFIWHIGHSPLSREHTAGIQDRRNLRAGTEAVITEECCSLSCSEWFSQPAFFFFLFFFGGGGWFLFGGRGAGETGLTL